MIINTSYTSFIKLATSTISMTKYLLLLLTVIMVACGGPDFKNPHVLVVTNYGDIEIELYPDKAPKTVAAFLSYAESGLYKNSSFYRVMKTEGVDEISNTGFIQGGIWKTDPVKVTEIPAVPHEPTTLSGLTHTDGVVSMARTGVGTSRAEFFICIGDQSPLDAGRRGSPDGQGYAAFGKVYKGMSIVRKIQATQSTGDAFDHPVIIQDIRKR